jgi:hypothetical protein
LDITDRFSSQWRTVVHPIFAIGCFPAMRFMMWLGIGKVQAAEILIAACAFGSAGLMYLALRGLGLDRVAGVVFSAVFLASATFIHWFTFIETYPFALLTLTFLLFVQTSCRASQLWIWALASAGTLAITTTNWALALAAAFFRLRLLAFMAVTIGAFVMVAAVALVQKATFPRSTLFFDISAVKEEHKATQFYLEAKGIIPWTPVPNMRSVLIVSAVAPRPVIEDVATAVGPYTVVNNQFVPIASAGAAGVAATACWLFLLGAGLWGAWRTVELRSISIPIILYLAFQLALSSFYGEVTFLYAGNFFPCWLMLAAIGWFTPLRKLVLGAAVAFVLIGGFNNVSQFSLAARMSNHIAAYLAIHTGTHCLPGCAYER